jgi:hypothetical protein
MIRRRRTVAVGVIGVMAAAVTVAVIQAGRTGTGDRRRPTGPSSTPVPVVIAATPSAVVAVRVRSRNALVEADRTSRGWQPRPGTSAASAGLLDEREDELFPLQAYRMLKVTEPGPDFGLADPELIVDVDEVGRRTETVEIGTASFNGEGFYARRRGDPGIYLLTRRAIEGLRSALRGEPEKTARSDRERERLAAAEELSDSELTTNPWLAQILAETDP